MKKILIDKLKYEKQANHEYQAEFVCGCDEVGRGCLAGPVIAAAVYIPPQYYAELNEIDDSKKLSEQKRKQYYEKIIDYAYIGIAILQADVIDEINIYAAARRAMELAVENLLVEIPVDYILTDAMPLKNVSIPHESIIKGDQKSLSIAAASIVAKCVRDNIMIEYSRQYPEYAFEQHKGYGTKKHLQALANFGVIDGIHRKSYKPIQALIIKQDSLF